jgi:protein TonB
VAVKPPQPTVPLAANWDEYRRRAADRLLAANPGRSYFFLAPDPLLAIPVVEVHLKEDGSVDQVRVIRVPSRAVDTVRLTEEAVRRAAPFGPVGHLPKPWRFTEVFLFDELRRFKPMSLDQEHRAVRVPASLVTPAAASLPATPAQPAGTGSRAGSNAATKAGNNAGTGAGTKAAAQVKAAPTKKSTPSSNAAKGKSDAKASPAEPCSSPSRRC